MRVLIIADNRQGSGRGHVIRCQALAEALRERDWSVDLVGVGDASVEGHDMVIMDLRSEARVPIERQRSVQIVDDTTDIPACDLLVNGSAGASLEMYRDAHARRILAGPAYSLLRPEFARGRERALQREGVLDLRPMVGFSASALVQMIATASVAISYGGMRAMECACLGTPTVLLPQGDGEHINATGLLAAGACVIANDYEAPIMAQTLLEAPHLLRRMAENARALVDGRGVKRVVQAIVELAR